MLSSCHLQYTVANHGPISRKILVDNYIPEIKKKKKSVLNTELGALDVHINYRHASLSNLLCWLDLVEDPRTLRGCNGCKKKPGAH